MRWSWLVLVALAALWPAAASAQLSDDDETEAPSLVSHLRLVQFRVVAGRILAESGQMGSSSTFNRTDRTTGRSERASIDFTSGAPTVHYELFAPKEELTIELLEGGKLAIRRIGKAADIVSLEFDQPEHGDLVLAVGEGTGRRVIQGSSLWHLGLSEPRLCTDELFPLLELLRPDWRLGPRLAATEESLAAWAIAGRVADRRQWTAWVEALGSDKYALRESAERKLLSAGPALLPFLENLDNGRLDTEQRVRIRDIVARLDDFSEDTVDRSVTWLAADPQVWVSLLSRPDESQRRLAVRQLSRLLGGQVEFNAGADATTRASQLARLRHRLPARSTTKSP